MKKLFLLVLFLVVSDVAFGQARVARITNYTVGVTTVTVLPNNPTRAGFCVMAVGTNDTANTVPVRYHTSSVAATVQAATLANSIALTPSAGACYDGPGVYTGPVTAISSASGQHLAAQEWP